MAAIAIIGVLGSTAAYLILDAMDDYMDATTTALLHAELSIGLDRLVREVRRIELDPEIAGAVPHIIDYTATSLDWEEGPTGSVVTYSVSLVATDLLLEADGFTGPILTEAILFTVRAFNEDNTYLAPPLTLAACAPIRRVEFTVSISRSGLTETLRAKIYLRAMMAGAG